MSVTTSTNTVTSGVLHVLTDYDLHHSGSPQDPGRPASPNAPYIDPAEHSNPDWWPTDHRRIPDYRPVNPHLDLTFRPDGINGPERIFIFTMLRGVQLNANLSYLWRHTGAHLDRGLFRYKIGGEK